MDTIVIASTEADAAATAAVEEHHAQMLGALAVRAEALLNAASRSDADAARAATQDLATWCEQELIPHASAEETTLYPAARDMAEGRLIVDSLIGEHGVILGLVRELTAVTDPVRAAAVATALRVLFDSHQAKENELILPLLAAEPGVALADLLAGMHEEISAAVPASATSSAAESAEGAHHNCGCGADDGPGYPELDARTVPHAIRHATIFGALDSVVPGGGMILVAPHDPLPLLAPAGATLTGTVRGRIPRSRTRGLAPQLPAPGRVDVTPTAR